MDMMVEEYLKDCTLLECEIDWDLLVRVFGWVVAERRDEDDHVVPCTEVLVLGVLVIRDDDDDKAFPCAVVVALVPCVPFVDTFVDLDKAPGMVDAAALEPAMVVQLPLPLAFVMQCLARDVASWVL